MRFIELNIFKYIQAVVLILISFCGSVDGSDGYKSPCHSSSPQMFFFILQISLLCAPVVRYFWRMLGQSDVGRVVSVA